MSESRPAAVIVLAAGEGTRMQSTTPKVLHELCGRSMLGHVLASAREPKPHRLLVVVGHGGDAVAAHVADISSGVDPEAETVTQQPQRGTGHAVRTAIEAAGQLDGTVLVGYADAPLLRGETLTRLTAEHEAAGNAVTVLSAEVPDPAGYGRVVREADGAVREIVEDKDADAGERVIREINSGVYAFDGALLAGALGRLEAGNAQGEEYLTDVVAILRRDGHRAGAQVAADYSEILGVNDRVQLAEVRRLANERLLTSWMRAGVTIVDPRTTWLDVDVTLEPDVLLHPGTRLIGATHVGAGAEIGPNSTVCDTVVGSGALVREAVCEGAEIGAEASVGPYAYLRQGTRLARKAKAGSYVEMKNADVGVAAKVPHLSYVGDATIGEGSNIGAATVFVNYDGVDKHRSSIGDHVRVGSDTMIVAPVTIGDGAYTAAGSVVTRDVPPGAMAVARGQQHNSEGWVERRRSGTRSAEAARRAGDAGQSTDDPSREQGE